MFDSEVAVCTSRLAGFEMGGPWCRSHEQDHRAMTLTEIILAPLAITVVMLSWFAIQRLAQRQRSANPDDCGFADAHVGCGSCRRCYDE